MLVLVQAYLIFSLEVEKNTTLDIEVTLITLVSIYPYTVHKNLGNLFNIPESCSIIMHRRDRVVAIGCSVET